MAQSETSFLSSGTTAFTKMAPTQDLPNILREARALQLERLNKKVMKQFESIIRGRKIQDERWSYVSGGVMVTFTENGRQQMTIFNDNGKWLFTISYVDEKQLPSRVRDQIKAGFRAYQIFGVEAIAGPNTTVFLAHIQNGKSWKTLRIHNENIQVEQDLSKSE